MKEAASLMTTHFLLKPSAIRYLLTTQRRTISLTPPAYFPKPRMSKETANEPAAKRQKKEDYVLYYVSVYVQSVAADDVIVEDSGQGSQAVANTSALRSNTLGSHTQSSTTPVRCFQALQTQRTAVTLLTSRHLR